MVTGLINEWTKIKLPKMVKVKQKFVRPQVENIHQHLKDQYQSLNLAGRLKPGAKIAVGVGSRGIKCITEVTKAVIDILKEQGFDPFIIPTMGSHGGATPEGQKEILEDYGITEEAMGVPIYSSLEVVEVGMAKIDALPNEFPVYVDKYAQNADGIVVINRVKSHTLFSGDVESGLMKMLTIGLGKHEGASMVHRQGFEYFSELIPAVGEKILEKSPIYFGVGIVENYKGEPADIRIAPKESFREIDRELLLKAKELTGKLLMPKIDLLIIQEIGKDISGDGMDPHVVGRFLVPGLKSTIDIQKVLVLDLSKKTEGNGNGLGLADVTTKRVFEKVNLKKSYINAYTATMVHAVKIPMIIDTDEEAIQVGAGACCRVTAETIKIAYIQNTAQLEEIWVSEALAQELKDQSQFEVLSEPQELEFDAQGNMTNWY